MASIHAERSIAADPTSTALLLAGPTALDLWPGLRRVGADSHGIQAEAVLADATRAAARFSVRARPPHRTPTSFVTRFEFTGDSVPAATGTVTLTYLSGPGGRPATSALLDLECTARPDVARELRRMAVGFLGNLAAAAEQRAYAA